MNDVQGKEEKEPTKKRANVNTQNVFPNLAYDGRQQPVRQKNDYDKLEEGRKIVEGARFREKNDSYAELFRSFFCV